MLALLARRGAVHAQRFSCFFVVQTLPLEQTLTIEAKCANGEDGQTEPHGTQPVGFELHKY